jgi:hypothetical protein
VLMSMAFVVYDTIRGVGFYGRAIQDSTVRRYLSIVSRVRF